MDINSYQARAMVEIDSISDILKLKYPEISEDMTSWKSNYACACGKRFLDFLNKKYKEEDNKPFIESVLGNIEVINKAAEVQKRQSEAYQKRIFSGKIIKIDKTPESWEKLSKTLQENNAIFKSFFITDLGDLLEVRFL